MIFCEIVIIDTTPVGKFFLSDFMISRKIIIFNLHASKTYNSKYLNCYNVTDVLPCL